MSCSPEKPSPNLPPPQPKKRPPSWSDLWFNNDNNNKALNNVLFAMQLQSHLTKLPHPNNHKTLISDRSKADPTTRLPDPVLLRILSKVPDPQRNSNSLVCKRWLALQGRLVRSLKLLDWHFLESGRLVSRFPNLTHVDLVHGCVISRPNCGVLYNHRFVSIRTNIEFSPKGYIQDRYLLPDEEIDMGLKVLASGCGYLRKLVVIGSSEEGLLSVAEECPTLQELELHRCSDRALRGISACRNLQVLKLVGNVSGFYSSLVSDVGLTILANGCERLVKLELSGCEGSYDGIKAIGQCCQMLEELSLCDHRMDGGWMAGLSYCENLKTLRFQSCKSVDLSPGPDEYLGSCPALERLHLQKCQLRDKQSVRALFVVCGDVKEIVFQDCWGLENDVFSMASVCRRVKFLSLEGCSLLTTGGLESVILSWKELQRLRVVSCKHIKDSEVTPFLSTLFTVLKELKWRPDSKSLLTSNLVGTGMGKRGRKFFKKT